MNRPRFADTDFIPRHEAAEPSRQETAEPEPELDLTERGMELLHKINEIIDLVTKDQPGGQNRPIVVQLTQT